MQFIYRIQDDLLCTKCTNSSKDIFFKGYIQCLPRHREKKAMTKKH